MKTNYRISGYVVFRSAEHLEMVLSEFRRVTSSEVKFECAESRQNSDSKDLVINKDCIGLRIPPTAVSADVADVTGICMLAGTLIVTCVDGAKAWVMSNDPASCRDINLIEWGAEKQGKPPQSEEDRLLWMEAVEADFHNHITPDVTTIVEKYSTNHSLSDYE